MEGSFGAGFDQYRNIDAIQTRLNRYFSQDKEQRFQLEGVLGGGEFGITWKLKYKAFRSPITSMESSSTPANVPETSGRLQPQSRYIVLKADYRQLNSQDNEDGGDQPQDDDDDDDITPYDSMFPNEKAMLQVLLWAKHISTGVEISNDPLTQRFPGTPWHQMRRNTWLYTEWVENGTVGKFVRRAQEQQIQLPNRLLWSFFLCLIRMVIAMGWPPEKPDGEDPQPVIEEINGPAYGALVHRDIFLDDLSVGNIMVGNLLPEDPGSEHTLAPILILIDLAEMLKDANRRAICYNIKEIACVMILFITLDHETAVLMSINTHTSKYFQESPTSPRFLSYAHILIDEINGDHPFPWLDGRLRALVCACLAVADEDRPEPQALLDITKSYLNDKGERYYASQPGYDGASESDERIRSVLSTVVFDA
ncbi:hypothetical protein F4803DRAFT_567511 [Xylaria telfairii]|nr:hypothetical protein F4803DRAFT_567511 [Xylaria telfairii]